MQKKIQNKNICKRKEEFKTKYIEHKRGDYCTIKKR